MADHPEQPASRLLPPLPHWDLFDYGSCLFVLALLVAEGVGLWWVFSPRCNDTCQITGFYLMVFGGLGLFITAAALSGMRTASRLKKRGITVQGQVIDRRITGEGERRRTTRYYLTYRYEYEGKTYSREEQVDKKQYEMSEKGAILPISLLPEQPQTATAGALQGNILHAWGCAIICFIVVAIVLFSIFKGPH